MAVKILHVSSYTDAVAGPSLPMLGPIEEGGTIIAQTAPCCWGGLITPHFKSGHEVTQPVAVEGAEVGDAIVIKIKEVKVMSKATSSGTSKPIEGRKSAKGSFFVARCPECGAESPRTVVDGIGPEAIKCENCGAGAIPMEMTCGYTMVFDDERTYGITVGKQKAEEIAFKAREYAALPVNSEQNPVLLLANADLPGILTRTRPFVGNIGTTPAMDMAASHNCGDLAQRLEEMSLDHLTDAHMDIDSVREGATLICPVKVDGGGIYVGDVHAMQGDGEIAGHTTDVSAEVTLEVGVIKGLTIEGPILLPPMEDLPFLAKPFSKDELEKGRRMAQEWEVELEDVAPIQVVGSGPDLNAATGNALERASKLLDMRLDEVRNRVTITGSIEIGRAPGVVTASLLAPAKQLDRLRILHLVKEQYGL